MTKSWIGIPLAKSLTVSPKSISYRIKTARSTHLTAYNSMLALLETQLPYDCHIHKTSIHENGISVSIKKVQGEIIRFFLTDNSLARACFAMNKQGVKCCDYLLLYTKENTTKKTELLCFIELKGKDIDKAGKQI